MSTLELFLIFVFAFFGLLPIPRIIYRNDVPAFLIAAMIGSIVGMIVLFVHHFIPK